MLTDFARTGVRSVAAITHLTDGDRAAFTETTGEGVRSYAAQGSPADDGPLREVKSFISMGANDDGVIFSGGYPSILISFQYDRGRRFFEEKLRYWPTHCMGDSGAFTVWTRGETIDLAEYIGWCQFYAAQRPDFIFISLDVIPGTPTRAPSKREQGRAIKQSLANGDQLREAGVKIMEVFHWHEPLSHLDLLIERRQEGELLGVGGLAGPGSRDAKERFLASVFHHVRPEVGWQGLVPLHGLGIAPDSTLCYRFPWFSVDSSSWSAAARFGRKVTTSGGRGGEDKRTKDRTVRHVYVSRVLNSWLKREEALSRLWAERGVTYLP